MFPLRVSETPTHRFPDSYRDTGTLRAGSEKTQIRYEQSRWKMGSARTGSRKVAGGKTLSLAVNPALKTSVAGPTTAFASGDAREGTEAGEAGRLSLAGAVQQVGVAQLAGSAWQQWQESAEGETLPEAISRPWGAPNNTAPISISVVLRTCLILTIIGTHRL